MKRKQMAAIFVTQFLEGIQLTIPFTIAVYMVRAFYDGVKTEEQIGKETGLLASMYSIAMFLSSYPIGLFSDHFGRKTTILIGNATVCASLLAFGAAPNYVVACTARFLGGLFNGTVGANKTILGESATDSEDLAASTSHFALAWAMGTIVGPSIGGFLASPCDSLFPAGSPACGPHGLFQLKPFLFPCLCVALAAATAMVCNFFTLEETLHKVRNPAPQKNPPTAKPASKQQQLLYRAEDASGGNSSGPSTPSSAAGSSSKELLLGYADEAVAADEQQAVLVFGGHDTGEERLLGAGGAERGSPLAEPLLGLRAQNTVELTRGPEEGRDSPLLVVPDEALVGSIYNEVEGPSLVPRIYPSPAKQHPHSPLKGAVAPEALKVLPEGVGAVGIESAVPEKRVVWWKLRTVQLSLAGYTATAFFFNLLDEVTPIFASAPIEEGGLAMPSGTLALVLIFSGGVLMAYQLFGYRYVRKKMGTKQSCRMGFFGTAIAAIMIPMSSLFAYNRANTLKMLFVAMAIRGFSEANCYTGVFILVNGAAPDRYMGQVNGLGMALAGAMRAIGPALGGLMWSLSLQLAMPRHQFFSFGFTALGCLLSQQIYVYLDMPDTPAMEGHAAHG